MNEFQNLHKWYGSEYGCVKVIPPACWVPSFVPWKRDAPRFRPKIQTLSMLNGENRQEMAHSARVRVSRFLQGSPLSRETPTVTTKDGASIHVKIRKLQALVDTYGIDIHAKLDKDKRNLICDAIESSIDDPSLWVDPEPLCDQIIALLRDWSKPSGASMQSMEHLTHVPPPLPPRDRSSTREFWTYTPRDDKLYLTRILNDGLVKKPTPASSGLPYVDISIRNPTTGQSCISRMDEEDIDMYLANGHSPQSARAATKCLLCEVCLGACGFPVDSDDLIVPDSKHPLPPATRAELEQLQSSNPALMCSGCGIAAHADCLGHGKSFLDRAALHYMAKTGSDWFCSNCIPPNFPRNAAHAIKFGYQFTDQSMSRKEYEKRSDQKRSELKVSPKARLDEIESIFWSTVRRGTEDVQVLYASDLDSGDFSDGKFDSNPSSSLHQPSWDLRKLSLSSESVLRHLPGAESITGVSRPWLYLGSFFSSFCWHAEDHFLCSISYHHQGAPKIWYTIPGEYRSRMEEAMEKLLPDLYQANKDLSHHLVTLIDPAILVKSFGIPVGRVVQNPGEFIITFPEAYHCGFNTGVNLAEAVNVACPDWFINHGHKSVADYSSMGKPSVFCFDELVWFTSHAIVKGDEIRKNVGEYCVSHLRNVLTKFCAVEGVEKGKMVGGEDVSVCEDCLQFCYFASVNKTFCLDCGQGKVYLRYSIKEIEKLVEAVSSRIAQYREIRRSNRTADAKRARTLGCEL